MKSITIHNLDDSLASLIQEKAKKEGLSLNKTIKNLLKKSLGIDADADNDHKSEFIDLFGVWSKQDENEFNRRINDLSKIDLQDWQ